MRLRLYTHIASEKGLSSVTTLIVGSKAAALINPPLLPQDAQSVIALVRSKTSNLVTAIFISHSHPDHYFAAGILLEAFPSARLFAAPYVVAAIDRERDNQIVLWSKMMGQNNILPDPARPEAFEYSFFVLPDDMTSPILLLGPVQGSSSDHTLFWLPTEQTIITGDVVFARSTHVAVEEIDNSASLAAWRSTLDFVSSLDPQTIVTGHVEKGVQFDARKDMEHMYRYLDLFENKIIRPAEDGTLQVSPQELFATFREAFPSCQKNLDFFLGRMADKFGGSAHYGRSKHSFANSSNKLDGFVMETKKVNETTS